MHNKFSNVSSVLIGDLADLDLLHTGYTKKSGEIVKTEPGSTDSSL